MLLIYIYKKNQNTTILQMCLYCVYYTISMDLFLTNVPNVRSADQLRNGYPYVVDTAGHLNAKHIMCEVASWYLVSD